MDNHLDAFQQVREIKSQSIDGLRQLCENLANFRTQIDSYTQNQCNTNTPTEK